MIDLYTWSTPNGRKVSIMLEECGLDYAAHAVDIGKNEQFKPDFLKISPNNRIPAIVDHDNGLSLFESGAILMYLAEKTGKFWSKEPKAHWHTMQWLMWQMGGVGPMLGQVHHFVKYNKGKAPYARSVISPKPSGSTVSWTAALPKPSISRATTPSQTWRRGLGSRVSSGRRST